MIFAALPLSALILLLALPLGTAGARAETAPAAPGSAATPEKAIVQNHTTTAPVLLDGRTLMRLRGISAFPAEKRAGEIAQRIEAFARDGNNPVESLRFVEHPDHTEIFAGNARLLSVFNEDAHLEGIERREVLATLYLQSIARAVSEYRQERSPRVLLINTGYALGAAALFGLVLWIVRWLFRRFTILLERRYKSRVKDLEVKSFQILQAEHFWNFFRGVLHVVRALAIVVSAYVFLEFTLSLYPWTKAFADGMLDLVLDPLRRMGHGVLQAVPGLVFIAILVVVTRTLLKMIRLFFASVFIERVKLEGFEPEWAWPTYRIVRLLVVAFALVVAYPYIPGSGSAAFQGITLFLGVIFSLGSTSIIANIIAGYTMTYRRAFSLGDRIQVGDVMGDVVEMRLLVTHVRSPKNEEIVIPNSQILNSSVTNFSSLAQEQGLILHTTVGIGYEVPWRQVEAMLLMAAERTEGLKKQSPPFVLQKSLGDFCVVYELNVHCDRPSEMNGLYSRLHENIQDVFNEYGVQIMTPAYERDTPEPKIVPKEKWYTPPAHPEGQEA